MQNFIPSVAIVKALLKATENYSLAQKTLNLAPPVAVCISLYFVEGFSLAVKYDSGEEIDRPNLDLPVCTLHNFDEPAHVVLRPALDALWNASGFSGCSYFHEDGSFAIE